MLIILPVLTFFLSFFILFGHYGSQGDNRSDWRNAFLISAVFLAGYMVIFTEILSLFRALTQASIALSWSIALVITLILGWRSNLIKKGVSLAWQQIRSIHGSDYVFLIITFAIIATLFVVAIKSVPNNTDSLQYHMSRVMHWAQDKSLAHYPTAYEPQLFNPIFAEVGILDLRLLWGNDQLSGLIQWFSMVVALIAVSAIVKVLGVGRKGQWAAVAFTASLPMGILQSTSTQNDYVLAFLLATAIFMVLLSKKRQPDLGETACLGLAVGLGLLTKGTAYPYFLPVAIWYAINRLWESKFQRMLLQAGLITLIVIVINLGFWVRNIITFGGPLGPGEWVSVMTAGGYTPGIFVSSVTRNILMNFATPNDAVNNSIASWYRNTFSNMDPAASGFSLTLGWNHEDLAGSPLQVVILAITLIMLLIFRKNAGNLSFKYCLVTLGSFLTLMIVLRFDPYGMRYHIPFWVIFAPLVGVAFAMVKIKQLVYMGIIGLFVTASPYIVFNRTRPLIAMRNVHEAFTIPCYLGCTSGSILNESPKTILFANWIQYREPYSSTTDLILSSGCKNVGLEIDSHDLEYVFWWLLGAPQNGIHIETINPSPRSERYEKTGFKPCAIICTICVDSPNVHGLSLSEGFAEVQVYQGDGYDPMPGQ